MPAAKAVPRDVKRLFSGYAPEIERLALEMRSWILGLAPEAEETVHLGWKVVSYGSPRGRKFCAIAPHSKWVNLQFHHGGTLDDPKGLLEGTGRNMRHVKVASPSDLKRSGLGKLLRAAAQATR